MVDCQGSSLFRKGGGRACAARLDALEHQASAEVGQGEARAKVCHASSDASASCSGVLVRDFRVGVLASVMPGVF
jgi:hypothetical protein